MAATSSQELQFYLNVSLWITLGTTIIIWLLRYHWKRRHLYALARTVPGPKGWPIIGNGLDFTGDCEAIFDNIMRHFNTFPNFFKVWFGPKLVYAISHPKFVEKVLMNPKVLKKHDLLEYIKPAMGPRGLFTAPIPVWKPHRKIILPTFNQQILNSYVEVFARQSTILGQQLENHLGESEFDVFQIMSRCTLDILCETTMGISMQAQTTNSRFGEWLERLLEIAFLRIYIIWYHSDFIFKQTQLYKDECFFLEKFNKFTENVIKERRKTFQKNDGDGKGKRQSFLDLLLEVSAENKLTEDDLRDEVKTFLIGGTDTTANTLSFIFILLGLHPEIQDRLLEEVLQVVGPDRMVESQDLPHLKFTERVIKETLRLFPPGGFIGREIDEDLAVTDEITIPGGASVLIGVLAVHRNPEVWPDPLKFDPDRFLPEKMEKRHPCAFLPFSKGPRNCVGFLFALMATKTILAMTIRKFRFSTTYKSVEDVKLKTTIMTKPIDGYKIRVKLRG